jgi:DNA-binding transcriptional ArsR family regulator
MNLQLALRALANGRLANGRRLQILAWLNKPTRHFPPQVDGELIEDGVCGLLIARKLRVSQPTASEHLKILLQANWCGANRSSNGRFTSATKRASGKSRR